MADKIYRIVTRAPDGSVRTRDYSTLDEIESQHDQVGIDDCSTELTLRGLPVFRGLIGPIPEGKGIARYESPDVFETLTKEWSQKKVKRRRRKSSEVQAEAAEKSATPAKSVTPKPLGLPGTSSAPQSIPIPGEFA